ncbi:hypothetical protein [Formosa algae]|uniref:hypothetical protein n=1 Tax=Formosa algae TaxID=225843 RepID=UPI000CCEDFCC|nr:hypothetical protein [Formosa algae]PNW28938.1 hypothetical protein BKP44_06770 [Formosa algae]
MNPNKKVPLHINEGLKSQLESKAKRILSNIQLIQDKAKESFNIDLSETTYCIHFIKQFHKADSNDTDLQNDLLYQKFDKEVSKIINDYPNLIKPKALDMFCSPEDREKAKELIQLAVLTNKELNEMNVEGLTFETFVLNNEFTWNSKIHTPLKDKYTTYCTNKRQVEILEFAQNLQGIIKNAIKVGIVSDTTLGISIGNFMDTDTGEINHQFIHSVR